MSTITANLSTITLTDDQQNALTAFTKFLTDPTETVFVLSGYSGTGKSTLVATLIDRLPSYIRTARLINPNLTDYDVQLTATTNKAAENLRQITGMEVNTIHSAIGLRVQTDYETGVTRLVPRNSDKVENTLLFIDEASYIDSQLLGFIFSKTERCKIVFMGDPAQLTPVKSNGTPVFAAQFTGASLTEVVRQASGNPILDLSTKFRETVTSGDFFSFKPDGNAIKHLSRDDFNKAIEAEFTRPDWRYQDSKILGWTNKCVIAYNHYVRDLAKGDPKFQVGDYAMVNKFISAKSKTFKTDQMVEITGIGSAFTLHDVTGHYYTLDSVAQFFGADSLADRNAYITKARKEGRFSDAENATQTWVDLRAAYACTVNKAQGSTYDKVFIDLDDIGRCNSGEQIARMLYVAVSRARHNVVLTGDIA